MNKITIIALLSLCLTHLSAQTIKPFIDSDNYRKYVNGTVIHPDETVFVPTEQPRFKEKKDIGEGFTAALQDGKWGLLKNDATLLPFMFDEVSYFSKGYARVMRNKRYGLINWEGKIVLETIYDDLSVLDNGYLVVKLENLWGIIGYGNKWGVKPIYQEITEIHGGYYRIKQQDKFGILSPVFQITVPPQYKDLRGEGDSASEATYAIVLQNEKKGLIDYNGQVLIPIIYDEFQSFLAKILF